MWEDWVAAGGSGKMPRSQITYPYLVAVLYLAHDRKVDWRIDPESERLDSPTWRIFRGPSGTNWYVRAMRKARKRVYSIDLILLRDHTRFETCRHRWPEVQFPYRSRLVLEPYWFWNYDLKTHRSSRNLDPPAFEVVFDWIEHNTTGEWSFIIEVLPNWVDFVFEFSFADKDDANRFITRWKLPS